MIASVLLRRQSITVYLYSKFTAVLHRKSHTAGGAIGLPGSKTNHQRSSFISCHFVQGNIGYISTGIGELCIGIFLISCTDRFSRVVAPAVQKLQVVLGKFAVCQVISYCHVARIVRSRNNDRLAAAFNFTCRFDRIPNNFQLSLRSAHRVNQGKGMAAQCQRIQETVFQSDAFGSRGRGQFLAIQPDRLKRTGGAIRTKSNLVLRKPCVRLAFGCHLSLTPHQHSITLLRRGVLGVSTDILSRYQCSIRLFPLPALRQFTVRNGLSSGGQGFLGEQFSFDGTANSNSAICPSREATSKQQSRNTDAGY